MLILSQERCVNNEINIAWMYYDIVQVDFFVCIIKEIMLYCFMSGVISLSQIINSLLG